MRNIDDLRKWTIRTAMKYEDEMVEESLEKVWSPLIISYDWKKPEPILYYSPLKRTRKPEDK